MYQQIAANKRKTVLVVIVYFLLFVLVGAAVGYYALDNFTAGIVIALVGGAMYSGMMIANSTNVVMSLNKATEIKGKSQAPQLWNIVEDMAIVAQVPMPRVFVVNDPSPNAFATGNSPEKAAVAVTTGLMERLNREELEGVIAHEFAHIRNYDVRLQTIAIALGAVIAMLVQFGTRMIYWGGGSRRRSNDNDRSEGALQLVFLALSFLALLLGPLMATIMQMALSRNREYLADATAVEFTRNPYGLISALEKISQAPAMKAADPQSAPLYFANPFKKGESRERDSLFATHPATSNRIRRLKEL